MIKHHVKEIAKTDVFEHHIHKRKEHNFWSCNKNWSQKAI